jgi:hypothetical protein
LSMHGEPVRTGSLRSLTIFSGLLGSGVQTLVFLRFSTVVYERGSPETVREPHGFAVKFYTREVLMIILTFCFCHHICFEDELVLLFAMQCVQSH